MVRSATSTPSHRARRASCRDQPKLQIEALDDGRVAVDVHAAAPVFYLTLSIENAAGEFDDNGITLLPGETRRPSTHPRARPANLQEAITVRHLRAATMTSEPADRL